MKGITNPVVCVIHFGKVPALLCTQLSQVLRYIISDIVRKLEFICTQRKSYNDGKTCVLQLLNHTLNFVPHIEYSCGESL